MDKQADHWYLSAWQSLVNAAFWLQRDQGYSWKRGSMEPSSSSYMEKAVLLNGRAKHQVAPASHTALGAQASGGFNLVWDKSWLITGKTNHIFRT